MKVKKNTNKADYLIEVFEKNFPKSSLSIRDIWNEEAYINLYACSSEVECFNGYLENDMFNISFALDYANNSLTITSNTFFIKPESQYYAYSSVKVRKFREQKDKSKHAKTIDNWLNKLKEELKKANKECKIHDNYKAVFEKNISPVLD